jgi:hypothetical protein
MKQLIILLILLSINLTSQAQDSLYQNIPSFEMKEIKVIQDYNFKNKREEKKYQAMEKDVRKVYPLLMIIRKEYDRINSEIVFYEGESRKNYLKWCEGYIKDKYFSLLSGLTPSQGRLLLKLIDREFEKTPYELIKEYRNGFRAALWNVTANILMSSLKSEYKPEKNPMIEHIIMKIDYEYRESSKTK